MPETREVCSNCALASDARLGGSSAKRGTMAARPRQAQASSERISVRSAWSAPAMCFGGFGAARGCTLGRPTTPAAGPAGHQPRAGPWLAVGPKKKREGERKRKKQRKFTALRGVGGGRTLSHQHRQGSWPVTLERWNLAAVPHCTLHGASASQPKPGRPTARGPLLAVVALTSSSSSPSPPIASSARP